MELLNELKVLNEKEVAMIKQKLRVDWLKNGDTNYSYFHSRLRWRGIVNEFSGIKVERLWVDDLVAVKGLVKSFIEKRLA